MSPRAGQPRALLHRVKWRVSSRSSGSGNGQCVEVGDLGSIIAFRDSKLTEGDFPCLFVTRESATALFEAIKSGRFHEPSREIEPSPSVHHSEGVAAKVAHPLKGEFDLSACRWVRPSNGNVLDSELEVGYVRNGHVSLRMAGDLTGDLLIFTPSEWRAFVDGVRDGEFDLDSWGESPVLATVEG